jgi:dTDP-4-dehydrorhamnose 3,5-epimerase
MKFVETELKGAFIVEPEPLEDERGFFTRLFCEQEFSAQRLETRFVQCSISFNHRKGTLRGMHYQAPPHEEAKIVRCTAGAIYDVIIDLRQESATYGKWTGVELSAGNRRMLYVPQGFAHGFQTLEDNSEVFYQISQFYDPHSARTARWDNPEFGIRWPLAPTSMSDGDAEPYPPVTTKP